MNFGKNKVFYLGLTGAVTVVLAVGQVVILGSDVSFSIFQS